MSASLLLDNFQTLAEAPNGVQKFRNMILELAMAGRLTGLAISERAEVKLRDIVRLRLSSYGSEPVSTKRNYEVVKVSNISGDGKFVGYLEKRSFEDEDINELLVEQGDVLVVKSSGSAERVLSGKAALCGPEQNGKLVATNFIFRLSPDEALVLPSYLWYLLNSPMSKRFVRSVVATFTYPNLKWSTYGDHPILLPSLPEQRSIVEKVYQLMALCDELEQRQEKRRQMSIQVNESALNKLTTATSPEVFSESWKRIKTNFDLLYDCTENVGKLKEAILQLAVQGMLVPQDPNDEPGLNIVERIKAQNVRLLRTKKKGRGKPLLSINQDQIPFALPRGWGYECLGDIALQISTGPFGTMLHKSDYVHTGVPLVNPMNIVGGRIVRSDKMMVSPATKKRLASYVLRKDDIVIARRGEMGRCAVVTAGEDGWLCGTGSFFVRLPAEIVKEFFVMLYRSKTSTQYLLSSSVGTTMDNLNHTILNNLAVPIPPLEEQHRIVAKVQMLLEMCDQLVVKCRQGQCAAERLVEAVVAG
jgi:type I restriction enzyme S subunit